MENRLFGRDIVAIEELSRLEIEAILQEAEGIKNGHPIKPLEGYLMGSCFFEPSTRTRLSFESAMCRLGGRVIGFADDRMTSHQKGETLHDTMKMMEGYVDLVVIRHPMEGAARWAADTIDIPVINAGDGANQHPTQTLLDLFSIKESQGTLDSLAVAIVGDLKYGRTAHSLARAAVHFGMRLYFVAPEELEMPREVCNFLRENGVKFSFHRGLDEVIKKSDLLYFTRLQKERNLRMTDSDSYSAPYRLTKSMLNGVKENLRILHPLPRNCEIDRSVDATPYAYYFQQSKNGLYVRQALLQLVLGGKEEKGEDHGDKKQHAAHLSDKRGGRHRPYSPRHSTANC